MLKRVGSCVLFTPFRQLGNTILQIWPTGGPATSRVVIRLRDFISDRRQRVVRT